MTANYPVLAFFSRLLVVSGLIFIWFGAGAQPKLPFEKTGKAQLAKGRAAAERALYDSAVIYFSQSLQTFSSAKDSTGLGDSFYGLGLVYNLQKKYKESITAQQKAFVLYQKTRNNDAATKSLLSLGSSSMKLKKYPDAKQFYSQALERSQRNSAYEEMAEAYNGLANVYEAQKDFKKAISSVRSMQGAYDSIAIRNHRLDIDEVEDKYKRLLDEKDSQLVVVESQHRQVQTDRLHRLIERDDIRLNFYAVALALGFVVLCLTMLWLITQRKAKSAEMILRREQAGIKTANEQFEIISRQLHDELTGSLNDISFSTNQLTNLKSQSEVVTAANDVKHIGQTLIANMMDMIWLINPNNRSLESLIGYIKEQTNAFLKQSGIKYMLVVPDKIPNVQLTSLERLNLYVVTRDLVHHAVNSSKASGLTLSITLEGRQMIFKVKDHASPIDEVMLKKRAEELSPLREKMEQVDGTIGIVLEQGAMVVIYRKDLH